MKDYKRLALLYKKLADKEVKHSDMWYMYTYLAEKYLKLIKKKKSG